MAWDDDTIDDPAAKPQGRVIGPRTRLVDEVLVARLAEGRAPGRGSNAERREAAARLAAAGMSTREIGLRLGVRADSVSHLLVRNGLRAAS